METQIQSLHFNIRSGLQDFILKKMEKLEKLYNRLEAGMVILKVDKTKKTENKRVEISLRMPGLRMFAKVKADTFEKAVVKAVKDIKHQLQRHKEKMSKVQPNGKEVIETSII